jgi:protein-S-isoprenylcysteine O-methyltransferase Ste14
MTNKRDTAGVVAPPPLLAAVTIVLGLILDWLLPAYVLSAVLTLSERIVVGGIMLAASASLGVPAILAFRSGGTHVEPWKPATALVTGGIFRWLRNPMYVGLAFGVAGIAIALASDWALVLLVPAALIMHFGVVRREERYLEAKFGEVYRGYKARVPRYGWPPV